MYNAVFYINSPCADGLFSLGRKCAEESSDSRTYSVVGGMGLSSEFVSDVAASVEKEGLIVHRFSSFYGKEGLEGAYFPEIDVYIFDADVPSFQMSLTDSRNYIINLGTAGNRNELYLNRALINEEEKEEKKYFSKAGKFLEAAETVRSDIVSLTVSAVNAEKIERFISRFVKKELGTYSSVCGREFFRLLTAVKPEGIGFAAETVEKLCPKVYCIDDRTGAVSSVIMSLVRENALLCGFDVMNCLSPFGKGKNTEHIIIPEIGLGVIASNDSHRYRGDVTRRINGGRFFDNEKMKRHRSRVKFNLNAEKELLAQASYLLGEGKKHREKYREICSRFYDKEKIKTLVAETTREIMSFIKDT